MGRAPRRRGRQAREQSTRQSTLGKGGESEQRVRVGNHLDCGGEEGQRSGGTKGRSTGREGIRRRPRIGGKALATGDADGPANKAHNQRKNKSKREKGYLPDRRGHRRSSQCYLRRVCACLVCEPMIDGP